jgi:hypothetical protein
MASGPHHPADRDELPAAIAALLLDAERRLRLGHAAHLKAANRYTWEGVAEQLMNVYVEVTAEQLFAASRNAVPASGSTPPTWSVLD